MTYQILKPDDVIEDGDEYQHTDSSWMMLIGYWGRSVSELAPYVIRRPSVEIRYRFVRADEALNEGDEIRSVGLNLAGKWEVSWVKVTDPSRRPHGIYRRRISQLPSRFDISPCGICDCLARVQTTCWWCGT